MKKKAGLWIDHRKALVMTITDNVEEIKLMLSNVERQARRSSGSRHEGTFEPQLVPADDSRQRAASNHLDLFYDQIIAGIKGAQSILIFGPGEAKNELRKRLKDSGLCEGLVAVETADKMSGHQVSAKIRMHFADNPSVTA
jgi:hypothetical protein